MGLETGGHTLETIVGPEAIKVAETNPYCNYCALYAQYTCLPNCF